MLIHRLVAVFVAFLIVGCSYPLEPYPETVTPEVFDGTVLKSKIDIKVYIYSDFARSYDGKLITYRLLNEPDFDFIVKCIQKPDIKFEHGTGGKYGDLTFPENTPKDNLDYSSDYLFANNTCLTTIDPFELPVVGWTLKVRITEYRGPLAASGETYIFRKTGGYWYHDKNYREIWISDKTNQKSFTLADSFEIGENCPGRNYDRSNW